VNKDKILEQVLIKFSPPLIFVLVFIGYIFFLKVISLVKRNDLLHRKRFSKKIYYTVMMWVPISCIILAIIYDIKYLLFFVISGFVGIFGETILSFLWDISLAKPIWTYHAQSAINGYTSKINFFPWVMGSFIFLSIGKIVNIEVERFNFLGIEVAWYIIATIFFIIGFVVTIILELFFEYFNKSDNKFLDLKFSLLKFLVFCFPIFFVYSILIILGGLKFAILGILFASIGNITEYLYSYFILRIFRTRLWTYNYLKIDNGHSSLTNLPLWAIAGLCFFIIADILFI